MDHQEMRNNDNLTVTIQRCPHYQEGVELVGVCLTCDNTYICSKCAFSSHIAHAVEMFSKVIPKVKCQLVDFVDKTAKDIPKLQQKIHLVDDKLETNKQNADACVKEVMCQRDKFHTLLEETTSRIIEMCRNNEKKNYDILRAYKRELQDTCEYMIQKLYEHETMLRVGSNDLLYEFTKSPARHAVDIPLVPKVSTAMFTPGSLEICEAFGDFLLIYEDDDNSFDLSESDNIPPLPPRTNAGIQTAFPSKYENESNIPKAQNLGGLSTLMPLNEQVEQSQPQESQSVFSHLQSERATATHQTKDWPLVTEGITQDSACALHAKQVKAVSCTASTGTNDTQDRACVLPANEAKVVSYMPSTATDDTPIPLTQGIRKLNKRTNRRLYEDAYAGDWDLMKRSSSCSLLYHQSQTHMGGEVDPHAKIRTSSYDKQKAWITLSEFRYGFNRITSLLPISTKCAWVCDYDEPFLLLVDSKGQDLHSIKMDVCVTDISISPTTGNIWFCSTSDNSVREITKHGQAPVKFHTVSRPLCMCVSSAECILIGVGRQIVKFTKIGSVKCETNCSPEPVVKYPNHIAECPTSRNVAVADWDDIACGGKGIPHVVLLNQQLQVVKSHVIVSSSSFYPHDVCFTSRGQLVVADYYNRSVVLLSGSGSFLRTLNTHNNLTATTLGIQISSDTIWTVYGYKNVRIIEQFSTEV